MLPPPVTADIQKYKSHLDDFLSKKYVDQSLLLGFNAVVQSKFSQWIQDDVARYHEKQHSGATPQNQDAEFVLVELLEILWGKFLHPIVKFYQRQHADLYLQSADTLKDKKKGNFKIVEMRKLNETFTKFVKSSTAAYRSILQHMMASYENPLLPKNYLADLDIATGAGKKCSNSDFNANLTFILYHCLLGLGNLNRHSATITVTYVDPCKSVNAYYRHLKQQDKNPNSLKHYEPALQCYHKCIGLLPALNEPYNHIGVIYNSANAKFDATLWFLRSQFTRIPNYVVGKVNLATIFKKQWLEGAYTSIKLKHPRQMNEEDINIWLLRILAQIFFSSFYKRPLNVETAEKEIIGVLFCNPETTQFVKNPEFIKEHLTVLICFFCWAEAENSQSAKKKIGYLFVNYLNAYLRDVAELKHNKDVHLPNLRFILAFLRKQTGLLSFDRGELNHSVAKAVNAIVLNDLEKQAHRLAILSDAYLAQDLPTRTHYFAEDVNFKDFGPIGFQFKDFQDTRLFSSDYVGPLFGGEYFSKAQGIPLFLDNYAVQQIDKEFELNSENLDTESKRKLKAELIAQASESLENDMRFCAIAKQVSNNFNDLTLDEYSHLLQVKVEVSATPNVKGIKKKSPKPKAEKKAEKKKDYASIIREGPKKPEESKKLPKKPVEEDNEVQVANLSTEISTSNVAPSSIEEIELMIAGHAQSFRQQNGSGGIDTEAGLSDMVNSIINDTYQDKSNDVVIPDSQDSLGALRTSTQEPVDATHQIQAASTQQGFSQQLHQGSPQVQGHEFLMSQPMMPPMGQTPQLGYSMAQSQFLQGPAQPFGYPQGYGMPVYPGMAPPPPPQATQMPGSSQVPDFQQYASIYGQPPGGFGMYGPQGPWNRQAPWNYYGSSSQSSQNFGSSQ